MIQKKFNSIIKFSCFTLQIASIIHMSFQFLLNNSIFQFKEQVMGKPSTCRQRFADPCVWIGRERNAEQTLGSGVQKLRPSITTFHYFFIFILR